MENEPTRVLLIEDNPGDADLVRLRLVESHSDVQVNCVPRLSDALTCLDAEPPTLVLLDLNLPDSHGADTFRQVMKKAPNVPVVILSGQDDQSMAIKAVHQGVQDYLVKADVTSKQLENALRFAVERQGILRALEVTRKQQIEFKNQFLSHVSHELRTPLTCIHQYITLLLDGLAGPVAPDQIDHLRTVLKSVNQLHAMIHDLLEAARVESGKTRIEPRCIDIGDLMQQAVAMMQPRAGEKHVGLAAGLDLTIPLVYADPDRTCQVLINLIDNGIKFTPPNGSVTVKAALVETDPTSVYLSVCDTGRGIPQDTLPLVFDRLYQDPDAVDGNRSGLGLGLYLAKEIVTLHGGRMWVASEPGSGSTFSFTLPLYSLGKLLEPAITTQGHLRESLVLVGVELAPRSKALRGGWKETRQQCLDSLRQCIEVGKDVVLPPMGTSGPVETFFVVASTDMKRVHILMDRIRQEVGSLPKLKASGTLRVTAEAIPGPPAIDPRTLEQQVWGVADYVTEVIQHGLTSQPNSIEKEHHGNA
ncbi:MAG TPA: hybrid sensor histidine kinase/response regulator [Terriglobales bacterium]|jgi:sigma-B regulation protein RsbU (phosphoserine phosphatase)|nr:hybrid sensor histidine kinase/response regulator [Terriglobales bacterium]